MDTLILNGHDLTLQDVYDVAYDGRKVEIAADAYARLAKGREIMQELSKGGKAIYGFNRGVGQNKDVTIDEDFMETQNRMMLRSHSLGLPPFNTDEEVRAMMVIRLNNMLVGASCASDDLANSYRDFLSTIRRALGVFGNTSECLRCAPLTRRYDRLRATTSTTTIEVMNQARDYMSEFCRMRRCLLPSVKIPFTYVIPPNEDPQEVFLVGSFTEWEKHRVPMHRFKNMFVVFLHLPAGDYLYKWVSTSLFQCRFIVDGQWRVSAKMDVFKDDGYNYNHAITVPKSTNTAVSRVIERLLRVC